MISVRVGPIGWQPSVARIVGKTRTTEEEFLGQCQRKVKIRVLLTLGSYQNGIEPPIVLVALVSGNRVLRQSLLRPGRDSSED